MEEVEKSVGNAGRPVQYGAGTGCGGQLECPLLVEEVDGVV